MVLGMSDKELTEIRSVLLSGFAPAHRGASLTAKICLHGDPAWLQATAPARQWSTSLWRSLTTPRTSPLSFRDHIRIWRQLAAQQLDLGPEQWRNSRGPGHRMLLSLERIGWRALSFHLWRDDKNNIIDLMYTSPAMVASLLQSGVQRSHERRLAMSSSSFGAERVRVDPLRSLLRSKRTSPRARYWICSCFSNGCWTADRLHASGYVSDGKCPLCGGADSLFHRQWLCEHPEVVAVRSEAIDQATIDAARSSVPSEHWFWSRLMLAHPGESFPPPSPVTDPLLQDGDGQPLSLEEFVARSESCDLVVDGSATQYHIQDLNRAAFAGVFLEPGTDYKIRTRFMASVWPSMHQTPQSAENLRLATACAFASGMSTPYSDCLGAVALHNCSDLA